MAVQYYANDDSNLKTPREFDTILFWYIEKNTTGELFLGDGKEKVIFDRENGSVLLEFVNPTPNLTLGYSSDIENQRISPIKNAIIILSKLNLLSELANLGDPTIKSIFNKATQDIQKAQTAAAIGNIITISLAKVFNSVTPKSTIGFTLFSQAPTRTPTQKAIYQALCEHNKVESGSDVRIIMQKIHEFASKAQPSIAAKI